MTSASMASVQDLPIEEESEVWQNRIMYTSPCRMGNWYEDVALKDEKKRSVVYKRDHCQLLVQKTRNMFKNLLKDVTLACEAPFVYFGDTYQIKACDLANTVAEIEGYKATHGLYLSALLSEHDINFGENLMHGCMLTASPQKNPCVRNTYVFVSCDGADQSGRFVTYGEDFYIRMSHSGSDLPLYVQCESSTFDNFGTALTLKLTQSPDIYCRFKIHHWKPDMRNVLRGTPVVPNSPAIVQHTGSGQNLAALRKWIPTLFGSECLVTCQTMRNKHRLETAENIWIVGSTKRVDINLYVRAAKGEEIPLDLLE